MSGREGGKERARERSRRAEGREAMIERQSKRRESTVLVQQKERLEIEQK